MLLIDDVNFGDVVWYSSLESLNPFKVIVLKIDTFSELWVVEVVETELVKYVDNEFLFLTEDEAEICSTLLMRKLVIKRNIKNQQNFDNIFKIIESNHVYVFESILEEIDLRVIKFENESPHLFLKHIMSEIYD